LNLPHSFESGDFVAFSPKGHPNLAQLADMVESAGLLGGAVTVAEPVAGGEEDGKQDGSSGESFGFHSGGLFFPKYHGFVRMEGCHRFTATLVTGEPCSYLVWHRVPFSKTEAWFVLNWSITVFGSGKRQNDEWQNDG
jgi:hypothetical protein